MNQAVPWIPWPYLVGKLCWGYEGREVCRNLKKRTKKNPKKPKPKTTNKTTPWWNDGTRIEISDIIYDTVVPFTKGCHVGKPKKSKKARLEYFGTLQTWNVSDYLILVVYAVIELVIIMLYYTNMINHLTAKY